MNEPIVCLGVRTCLVEKMLPLLTKVKTKGDATRGLLTCDGHHRQPFIAVDTLTRDGIMLHLGRPSPGCGPSFDYNGSNADYDTIYASRLLVLWALVRVRVRA